MAILWPLVYNEIRRNKVSNTFGKFAERKSGSHWGWDFYAAAGTPCYAIADGTIVDVYGSPSDTGSFGQVVVLKFEYNKKIYYAAYCHLSKASAAVKQPVKAGELLGYTGNSGNASNMKGLDEHLHFEIRNSARPGPGGPPNRISPIKIYNTCPLNSAIIEP